MMSVISSYQFSSKCVQTLIAVRPFFTIQQQLCKVSVTQVHMHMVTLMNHLRKVQISHAEKQNLKEAAHSMLMLTCTLQRRDFHNHDWGLKYNRVGSFSFCLSVLSVSLCYLKNYSSHNRKQEEYLWPVRQRRPFRRRRRRRGRR